MSKKHLYIAGTGRAGTTFLVRYLTALGLDTTLSRNPSAFEDAERAYAGIEEPPSKLSGADLPYVVKSPWLHLVVDKLLDDKAFCAEAVIIPVRDLKEAAASRLIIEQQSMIAAYPSICELRDPLDVWGSVPGGALHSMHLVDEERLLAVGAYNLIERLVRENIPIIFLHFPLFAQDGRYLYKALASVLPGISEERSLEAFSASAQPEKVRTAHELADSDLELMRLQNAALKREVMLLQKQNKSLKRVASQIHDHWLYRIISTFVGRVRSTVGRFA